MYVFIYIHVYMRQYIYISMYPWGHFGFVLCPAFPMGVTSLESKR